MKKTLLIAVSLLLAACATPGPAAGGDPDNPQDTATGEHFEDRGPDQHLEYQPHEIQWQAGPGSLDEGSQFAMLEGDAGEFEVFTMRIRMPDGFVINPHWHPGVERVTVISGTFRLGHGEEVDVGATTPLGPGSYVSMPPGMRHFAIAEGETIIQLSSVGPWEINYVNPDDDPRQR
ncbi:MAG: cupin domain-containing protein [Bradymonadaceae bacterium]